jgi:hypothetical protein
MLEIVVATVGHGFLSRCQCLAYFKISLPFSSEFGAASAGVS